MGLISSIYGAKTHRQKCKEGQERRRAKLDRQNGIAALERHTSGLSNAKHAAAEQARRKARAKKWGWAFTYIYGLTDPRDPFELCRYIGKSNYPRLRYKQHLEDLDKCNPQKTAWLVELAKAKIAPKLLILEKCRLEDWKDRERAWIANYRHKLLNMTKGGDQSSR